MSRNSRFLSIESDEIIVISIAIVLFQCHFGIPVIRHLAYPDPPPAQVQDDYAFVPIRWIRIDCQAMQKTALAPLPESVADDFATNLIQTPMPVGAIGTVRADVNIFRGIEELEDNRDPFPQIGDEFYGFELVEELGRGSFGRVYLAREHKLADRPVVLKITLKPNSEQFRLARLQHTNIVPIQNAYRRGPYHIVQMPYFGRQTLSDVIDHVRKETGFPNVGGEVFSTVAKATTQRVTRLTPPKDDSGVIQHDQATPTQVAAGESSDTVAARPLRDLLSGMPYPDAVLTIIRRLADGLAHAHNRGILHLDLKPQNVLFGDDGQPMLLDFNLAVDRHANDRKRVGGTWPYMAPETIREFAKISKEAPDERTDLYALGVMYFELLTCRLPFTPIRRVPEDLPMALAERAAGIPSVREFNPDVSPAVESIIRKLTDPIRENRYASVDELREDLQRQQDHRPLRYAPDRSLVERFQKWERRNPNLFAKIMGSITILAMTFGVFLYWNLSRQQFATTADREVAEYLAEHEVARSQLSMPTDKAARAQGAQTAIKWLESFGAGRSMNWKHAERVRSLSPERRKELLNHLGEAALLLANSELIDSRGLSEDAQRVRFETALKWNKLAEECFEDFPMGFVYDQRLVINNLLGLKDQASEQKIEGVESNTERFCRAVHLIADGRVPEAINYLKTVTEVQPDHYAGQLLLGLAYQSTGQSYRALERLQVARPLAPSDYRASYHIGILNMHQGKYDDAVMEFAKVIEKNPNHTQAYLQRAHIHRQRGKTDAAIEDYERALKLDGPELQIRYHLAELYQLANKTEAAKREKELADSLEPKSPEDYGVRASRYLSTNPTKALELYAKALELNPFYIAGWHNKAYVLSDQLGETELAIETFKKAIEIAPGFAPSRAGLAILYARNGRREEAHKEIRKALALTRDPEIVYQAACVFGITSQKNPEDRSTSLEYFRKCFQDGFRKFFMVLNDKDMKPLLECEDYKVVLEAAQRLIR